MESNRVATGQAITRAAVAVELALAHAHEGGQEHAVAVLAACASLLREHANSLRQRTQKIVFLN